MDKKTWTKRRIVGFILIAPAIVVNYVAVYLLITVFNFQHVFILSAVFVGDVLGIAINSLLQDWNYRMIHKYGGKDDKLFRYETCPHCGGNLGDEPEKGLNTTQTKVSRPLGSESEGRGI